MSGRLRPVDEAGRLASVGLVELGGEYRDARLKSGRTQEGLSRALGVSRQFVMRVEHGRAVTVSHVYLARHAAAVGLRLHARAYPAGLPLRDGPQMLLLSRFHAAIGSGWRNSLESPTPLTGDSRAWDDLLMPLAAPRPRVGVEAITRARDLQAQLRPIQGKRRDTDVDCAILLLGDTRNNRLVLREHRHLLASDFPLGTRAVLHALRHGQAPSANGIVIL